TAVVLVLVLVEPTGTDAPGGGAVGGTVDTRAVAADAIEATDDDVDNDDEATVVEGTDDEGTDDEANDEDVDDSLAQLDETALTDMTSPASIRARIFTMSAILASRRPCVTRWPRGLDASVRERDGQRPIGMQDDAPAAVVHGVMMS
ncbi:MAG: hypothetical protein JWN39_3661, partial [Ilumatobacteraceae bacterium]|nr:hypothetical protein [Ilumatobacteraceae bacterium]